MPLRFWKSAERIKRPADVLKDQIVFDLNSSELSSMIIVDQKDSLKLTCHNNYKKTKLYEIIYTSSGNCLYSLYRTKDKNEAKTKFIIIANILMVIHKELCLTSRSCFVNARNLENAVHFILKYQHWLPIHFAARFGLANFFKDPKYKNYIDKLLNSPSQPLLRTPLMLAVLSNDLETVKAILNLNPLIKLKDRRGNNILHFAAICPPKIWSPVFKYCMINGHAFNLLSKRNNKLVTPVHFVCYSKNFESIVELLKIGLTVDLLTIESPYVIKKKQVQGKNLKLNQNFKTDTDSESSDQSESESNKRIVYFTDEMIADLKFEDMIFGGTPLHWCQYKRTLERLIEYEFNVNTFDLNNDTALTKCIKDNRFKCLLILLNAGADPNLVNRKGNTSLHEAVLCKDIAAVQACICWDAKLDVKNKKGETARHLASIKGTTDDQLIVHILHCVGASRCDKKMMNCRPDCSYSGLTNGKKYAKWPSFERECPYFPFLNQKIIETKLQEQFNTESDLDQSKQKEVIKKIRMICFDGGGTKGLISVQMLMEIEKQLKHPINEYFEWMSGTSTGSLITAMLALKIPLRNIKVIYYMLKDKIMIGPRPYDAGLLECLLQGLLGENLKMGQIEKKIIITGTLADRTPCQLHLFRSYPSPNEVLNLRKQSIERLLYTNKESVKSQNLDKMRNANPHKVIIELLKMLSSYTRNSEHSISLNKNGSNSFYETSTETNDTSVSSKVKSFAISPAKSRIKNSMTKIFSINTNTTLCEFTDNPNELHLHDESVSSNRLKFFHIPDYLNQKLWLAIRSSGAAPTFFRASGPFIDGGIISNNPVLDTLTDFVNYNCALQQRGFDDCVNELDLVLSIGTGKPPVVPTEVIDIGKLFSLNFLEPYQSALQAFNLAQEMVAMATQTDAHVVQRGQAWCNSMQVAYFRLNPPISENLQLNEVEEVEIVNALWETKAYMYNQRSFIEVLVKLLERHSLIST